LASRHVPGLPRPDGLRQVTGDGPGKPTGQVIYICDICKMETARPYKIAKDWSR